jgi:hypothetical protein
MNCPRCGAEMVEEDDHGRYRCTSCFYGHDAVAECASDGPPIPQMNVEGMSDAEKARVPPIYRLNAETTTAEADLLRLMNEGMALLADGVEVDSPEYQAHEARYAAAQAALTSERGG